MGFDDIFRMPDNTKYKGDKMTNLEAFKEILDITHNRNTGISKYVGHQRLGNLVVYKPEDINRIGHLCREAIAKGSN